MSGPPVHRHQVEFSNDVAQFFDDLEREQEEILLRIGTGPFYVRPLRYRGTDYGQWTSIWRLGLLTAAMGGPGYAGNVLHFRRISIATNAGYQLSVTGPRSAAARRLEALARRTGRIARTAAGGGRLYGYWPR